MTTGTVTTEGIPRCLWSRLASNKGRDVTIVDALGDVYDPRCAECGLSVVDMGLVEDIHIEGFQCPSLIWQEAIRKKA
jgi:hypothetical protein